MIVPFITQFCYRLVKQKLTVFGTGKNPFFAAVLLGYGKLRISQSLVGKIQHSHVLLKNFAGRTRGLHGSVRGGTVNFVDTVNGKTLGNSLCLPLAQGGELIGVINRITVANVKE